MVARLVTQAIGGAADVRGVLRRISPLLVLLAFLTACGEATDTTEAVPTRSLARPDVEVAEETAAPLDIETGTILGVEVEPEPIDDSDTASGDDEGVEREVEPVVEEPLSPGCIAVRDLLIGPDAATFYEAELEEALGLAHDAFSMLGHQATELALDLASAYIDGDIDGVAAVYRQMDAFTLEPCGFPGGGAFFAVPGSVAVVKFCEVSSAIGDDEPDTYADSECAAEKTYPTSLPCFQATGSQWADLASGGIPWDIVDCGSGVPVRWDHRAADWVAE